MEPWKAASPKAEDAPVGGHQPVAPAVGGGGHVHDGSVEVDVAGGAVEGGVAEAEDAAVGGHQPVAPTVGGGGHAHDRSVQVTPAHGAVEGLAEGEDPAVGGRHPIPAPRGTGHRLAGLPRVGTHHERRLVDRLEGAGRHLLQLVHQCLGPTRVGGAPEVPVGSVVGQDQPVVLHGPEHHLGLGREGADVEVGLESESGTHGREVGVAGASGLVPGGPQVGGVGGLGGHPDGVGDGARQDLVVAHQAGQDGESGGVSRGPSGRS